MILISDIHGCYKTLLALLAQCPKGEAIYFCGDLIDRGPRSKEVIQYAIDNKIPTVRGNHEDMFLCFVGRNERYDAHTFLSNGGMDTLKSYSKIPSLESIPKEHIDWIDSLPLLIEVGKLHISHTGHAGRGKISDEDAVWRRDHIFPYDGKFRVFGHTPNEVPRIRQTYANIDTACAYGGVLTALQYPEMKLFHQKNID